MYSDHERPNRARAPVTARAVPIDVPARQTRRREPLPTPPLQQRFPFTLSGRRNAQSLPVGGMTKRAFDLCLGIPALIVLAPILIGIGIAIRLTSPGPALFRQRRVGLAGRAFIVIKFRTMRTLDDGKAVSQARRTDPRITPIGAFLRRTSLDELPQLLNVITGEMSLIGPRPHAVAHDREFLRTVPNYRHRWRARPGISGLAQVSGCRGLIENDSDIRRRADLDAAYVDRWSVWLDIQIIIKTLFVAFNDEAAF